MEKQYEETVRKKERGRREAKNVYHNNLTFNGQME